MKFHFPLRPEPEGVRLSYIIKFQNFPCFLFPSFSRQGNRLLAYVATSRLLPLFGFSEKRRKEKKKIGFFMFSFLSMLYCFCFSIHRVLNLKILVGG